MAKTKHLAYSEARCQIQDGDMLLFRPTDIRGVLIALGSVPFREWFSVLLGKRPLPHSHAARAIWWGDSLWAVQQISNPYQHLQRLSMLAEKYPGVIDVFQLRRRYETKYDRTKAVETHKDICLRPYGWWNLLRLVPRHLPFIRRLLPQDKDDYGKTSFPPFCSMAYSMSDRAGGIDPCPNLPDRDTEPHHLAKSPFYRLAFTLS